MTTPLVAIVTAPVEPVVTEMLLPAIRKDVPSVRFVREPLNPVVALKIEEVRVPVVLLKARREDAPKDPTSLN